MVRRKLSDLIEIISGGTPKTSVKEFWGGDIGWLSVTDFNNDQRFVYSTEKTITKAGVENSSTKFLAKGDIIISARGTVGALAQIGVPLCFNQSCFGLRGKRGVVDNDFLYYSLKNYVKNIVKRSQGSVFDTINLKSFDLMQIDIPESIIEQKKIAKILSDLDRKIELNNKINGELESMAKRIYDYWFVQFDFPDENGKPYKLSGGKMVYNDELKREIPAGWAMEHLEQIIDIYDSERIPLSKSERKNRKGIYPYYGATGVFDYIDDFIFDGEYILLAEDGSVMNKEGNPIVQYIWGKTWVNNHAHVIRAKREELNEYIFQALSRIPVILIKSGSIQMKINQKNLLSFSIVKPPEHLMLEYSDNVRAIREKMMMNKEENQELEELRDWLLPMLMNGQVTIKD